MAMTDLDWYDRFRLLGEDDASIKERRDDVVNQNVNASFTFIVKILVMVEPLDSSTPHHSVHLPHLIVLRTNDTQNVKKVKPFKSRKIHRAALISVSLALSLHCETTDMGLVHRAMCLFMPQLSLVLTVPTNKRMARLS